MKLLFPLLIASVLCAPSWAQQDTTAQRNAQAASQANPGKETIRPANYPPGSDRKPVADSSFLDFRERYYIRPRAYPKKEISEVRRLQAYEQLLKLRRVQERPHIGPNGKGGPGKGGPGAGAPGTGPGGCAWASAGPTNINGRVTGIAVDPNNNQKIYVTSVGGIWRSTDGGRRWQRVSDDFLATVFASVAVNPGNSNEILAGAGDPNYGGGSMLGVWRSTSGGAPGTWQKVSGTTFDNQGIFRLRIAPAAPHNIYAATSAGVYVGTHSGTGITWARLNGFDAYTSDLVVDFAANPHKVYAGVASGSATFAKGIWKFDGTAWHEKDSGIPAASLGKVALGLAASNTQVLYAKLENASNGRLLGIYKTTNGGEGNNAWVALPSASVMDDSIFSDGRGYSWYNSLMEVDPADANRAYGAGLGLYGTTDGGTTWNNVSSGPDPTYSYGLHADQHALAFDPTNSKLLISGNDGGMHRSTDVSQATWHWRNSSHGMVMTEFYRMTSQQRDITLLAGGSQDNGTEITFGNRTWYEPGGCDGNDVAADAVDSDTLYANCNGGLYELVNPVPYTVGGGSTIGWTLPTGVSAISPVVTDPGLAGDALMAGKSATGEVLLQTTDGQNWTVISPTLPAGASIGFIAIAPSSGFQTYYVGIAQGGGSTVWRTTNGGVNWSTTANGLPFTWPSGAAIDYTNPNRAFAAFGAGGIFFTQDGGANWTSVAGTGNTALPGAAAITGVAIDPADASIVFVSSDIGVFRGTMSLTNPPVGSWAPFDEGLPDGLDINGIWVNRASGILTIGTMGHGMYTRDVRHGILCPAAQLLVRDNVFDHGVSPSPGNLADPEHPVPDPARPGFYKPDDVNQLFWWSSTDIRIDVPSADPVENLVPAADSVELQSCPIEVSSCPAGTVLDSNPRRGVPAVGYVQVTNPGLTPASNVRVIALWADATAGLPLLPNDFWTTTFPPNSTTCGPLNTSTGWNAVDPSNPCRVIPAINPEYPEVAQFPWNVPASAKDHSCFLAITESADDPLDPSVRGNNELRLWVLVPNNRQIGLRNLHVVDPPPLPRRLKYFFTTLNVPNPVDSREFVDLQIATTGISVGAHLTLILPRGEGYLVKGAKRGHHGLNDEDEDRAEKFGLDKGAAFEVENSDVRIFHLRVPSKKTATIGIVYQYDPEPRAGTSSRFTVIERQGSTVLGGSTYIVRAPAPTGKKRHDDDDDQNKKKDSND
ncbi:MAG TPA: hypothetical protein VFI38_17595 [Candidatus Acidoferrum sp.]|nr:hypothetical protein [Candidatus Acidoferrum sp.]